MHLCVYTCAYTHMKLRAHVARHSIHAAWHEWRSEGNLWESILSFQYVVPGDWTQVSRLAGKWLLRPLILLAALCWWTFTKTGLRRWVKDSSTHCINRRTWLWLSGSQITAWHKRDTGSNKVEGENWCQSYLVATICTLSHIHTCTHIPTCTNTNINHKYTKI